MAVNNSVTVRKTCTFCLKNEVKYTCPKCNIQYCSSVCYKCDAHLDCSENFYKECFIEGLKDMGSSPEDKKKVMEILQKIYDENVDSDDDLSSDDLGERLKGLNLDTQQDKVWSVLTEAEKTEFNTMVSDGRMSSLISIWSPWWLIKSDQITEMDHEKDTSNKDVPEICANIADIKSLLKNKSPSVNITFNVINVLYGYAYISRLYNGDCKGMLHDCVQNLQDLCGAFGREMYSDASQAVHACETALQTTCNHIAVSPHYTTAVVEDVVKILQGPDNSIHYVLAALSDVLHSFSSARKEMNKTMKSFNENGKKQMKKESQKIFECEKKLEFLLSYVNEYEEQFSCCVSELEDLFCGMMTELGNQDLAQELVKNKKLIKEKEEKLKRKLIEEL